MILTGTYLAQYSLGVEKRKSHYSLEEIKATFCSPNKLNITVTALRCLRSLGMTLEEVVAVIQSLRTGHFYKSMTNDYDASIWQDVYHAKHGKIELYIKFTTDIRGYLLISFKEK